MNGLLHETDHRPPSRGAVPLFGPPDAGDRCGDQRDVPAPLTVRLAEAFGSKPVRKTLRQLVDELVETNIDGAQASTTEERWPLARRAEEIDAEINRRLAAIEGFHQPEATQVRAILDGEGKAWWQA